MSLSYYIFNPQKHPFPSFIVLHSRNYTLNKLESPKIPISIQKINFLGKIIINPLYYHHLYLTIITKCYTTLYISPDIAILKSEYFLAR